MSDDILSGGRIDESTDGPNPPSVDPRGRDILGEQKAKEQQDAVGGTQYAPRAEPPPPIPVAPEVAPPLPVVPSFDFNFSGSPVEEVREITRQALADAFKNVTINGQSPSIDGSAISFTVQPQQPSASESFMFQNGEVGQAGQPTAPPIPLPVPPQPRNEDVQTVVVSPPSRPREEPESMSEQRQRENSERETRNEEIRVSLGLDPVSPMDRPSETVTTRGPSISEQNEEESVARAQRDTSVRYSSGVSGESPMDEESDSAQAYQRAEARRDERRESDPNFDRESGIRQRGETPTEFKERQEQLKEEKIVEAKREELVKRAREGDMTEIPTGMIPVVFDRADGQNKILTLLATEFVGTVEGGSAGTRMVGLPPETEYYLGGGSGAGFHPFKIYSEVNSDGETLVKVESASSVFKGFDSFDTTAITGLDSFIGASGGYVIVKAQVSTNGTVTSQEIIWGLSSLGTRITFDEEKQTEYRFPIAFLFFVNGVLQIRQLAFTDKTLVTVCVDGKGAVYPISA